jgi:hypothetical protein
MKNAIFLDVTPCGSCVNRRFGRKHGLHLLGRKTRERVQLLAHASSSLADFSILKMQAIRPSETSIHTRTTRRHLPEDGIVKKIVVYLFCMSLNLDLLQLTLMKCENKVSRRVLGRKRKKLM